MRNNEISETAESKSLSIEIKKLSAEYLELYTQFKDMTDNEPLLYSVYLNKLGYLLFELFEKKTECSRLKMKMELIQTALNRDEKPDIPVIEVKLNTLLSNYYQQINKNAETLETAKQVLRDLLPPEFVAELKEIFHLLCKKLHPDLNPHQTENDKDLFLKVKAAYDLNDLTELKKILLNLDSKQEPAEQTTQQTTGEKRKKLDFISKNIAVLKERIEKLNETFPYNMKDVLNDDDKVTAEQDAVKVQINFYEQEASKYEAFIELMLS